VSTGFCGIARLSIGWRRFAIIANRLTRVVRFARSPEPTANVSAINHSRDGPCNGAARQGPSREHFWPCVQRPDNVMVTDARLSVVVGPTSSTYLA
jgi:hypothetical protein